MLEYEEALARILAAISAVEPERLELADACGRVLAEPVLAGVDLPPFDNSSMDGYAVRAADVAAAKPDAPAVLTLLGRAAAGEVFPGEVSAGGCVRLFTGSPLPRGADAVVMQEDTRTESSNLVRVLDAARPWENVRFRGEDVKQGSVVGQAGDVLSSGRIALLAATGCKQVAVGRRPTVALLATGSELREPGEPLEPGQIYESNRLALAGLVRHAGGTPRILPLVPDDLRLTKSRLAEALDGADFVVTSGGVSVGEMDFIKPAFEETGGELQFWKVAIKPGRPFVFGRARDTRDLEPSIEAGRKFFFGLPGNPVSAVVTFLLLVRPAIFRWQGATDCELPRCQGLLAEPLANDGARRHFIRVKLTPDGRVLSAGIQASHMLSSLAAANGLVDVPPQTTFPAGTNVPVLKWK